VRATEDIDILTRPEGLEKIHASSAFTALTKRSSTGCHRRFVIGSLRSSKKRGHSANWSRADQWIARSPSAIGLLFRSTDSIPPRKAGFPHGMKGSIRIVVSRSPGSVTA
jgi:hypothetical protein